MADVSFLQTSFLGGEWSLAMQGRADRQDYRTALGLCLNTLPLETAAAVRRPGTRFIGLTRAGASAVLRAFHFSSAAPYTVELTDHHIRFTDGKVLATDNSFHTVKVLSGTPSQLLVKTADAHGWNAGDGVQFFSVAPNECGAPELLGQQFYIQTVVDPVTFILPVSPAGLNAAGMTISRIQDVPTPFTASQLSSVQLVQNEKIALLLHGAVPPQVLKAATGSPFSIFSLAPASFVDGPYLDPPSDGSYLTPSGTSGLITLTLTPGSGATAFAVTDVGRHIRLFSEPAAWSVSTAYVKGNFVKYQGAYYQALNAVTGGDPETDLVNWAVCTTACAWTWGVITAYNSPTSIQVQLSTAATDAAGLPTASGPLLYTLPINVWRMGAYGGTNGWPTVGLFYENRFWLAGAIGNRVDATQTLSSNLAADGILNFAPTGRDGTVADNLGISAVFASEDVNTIYWLLADHSGIVCGTQGGEWVIQASALSDPLTPTSLQAHKVTKYRAANVPAIRAGLSMLFVQAHARKLIEYMPDAYTARFAGSNLALPAPHITKPGIVEIAYQAEVSPTVWVRGSDGSLASVTYRRDSPFNTQPAAFAGWARHSLGSGRSVQSIQAGPSPGGDLDTVVMVTQGNDNTYFLEALTPIFEETDDISSSFHVDAGSYPTAVTFDGTNYILYGYGYAAGKTLSVFGGSAGDLGDYLVSGSGTIVIPAASAAGVSSWLAGYSYVSRGQILRTINPVEAGSQNGPALGKTRRAHQFAALVANAQGQFFGTDFSHLHAAEYRSPGGTPFAPNTLYNGIVWSMLDDDYSFDSQLCWEVRRPYPATILALGGFQHAQDR